MICLIRSLIADQQLRQRYCPPLDEALFFALASDFDLNNDEHRQQLEQILDGLKEQAVVEQELELAAPIPKDIPQTENSDPNTDIARTNQQNLEDNLASVTTGISDLTTSETTDTNTDYHDFNTLPEGLENASTSDKERWLKTLFPSIESVQITETLSKCDGDLQRSVDELLNLSFIHDDIDEKYEPPPVLRGIDGFAARDGSRKTKTRKTRRKQENDSHYLSDDPNSSSSAPSSRNVWNNAMDDVDFVASRTQMSTKYVHSIYNQNNGSLALTIRSLITKEAETQSAKIWSDEILQIQAAELKFECEGTSDKYIYGALLLAQMHPSAAKDLLDAMVKSPGQPSEIGRLIPQYVPVNLSEDEEPKKRSGLRTPTSTIDPSLLLGRAGVHSIQASSAFQQASSAYRRGKSDKLMGGAAAYYASVGHEERKRHKQLMASAADAHVGQQSTANSLDLHGVTVEHAVRIAKNSVEDWWEALGDRKYVVGGIGSGYKIIVGVGTHSAQGIGRIGPAVSKMLMREGWKVNVQRGEVVVEGRVRR